MKRLKKCLMFSICLLTVVVLVYIVSMVNGKHRPTGNVNIAQELAHGYYLYKYTELGAGGGYAGK